MERTESAYTIIYMWIVDMYAVSHVTPLKQTLVPVTSSLNRRINTNVIDRKEQ